MSIFATSATRAHDQTRPAVNQRIHRKTQINVAFYAAHPEQIDQRLEELDREWDIERCLEATSASLSLLGITLGLTRGRWWLLLPVAVQSLFLQHGVQGWCPPLPVFRRLGVRTMDEIEAERQALKAIRGDFRDLPDADADRALEAVER